MKMGNSSKKAFIYGDGQRPSKQDIYEQKALKGRDQIVTSNNHEAPVQCYSLLPQGSQRIFTRKTTCCHASMSLCQLCDFFVFMVVKNTWQSGLNH